MSTVTAMLVLNPVYAWFVGRVPRRRFIPIVYRFFALNLLVFFVLDRVVDDAYRVDVGRVFYVWLSVFNLFAVSIFWQFMNDGFSPEQAKRLFGLIGVGGTLGAVLGSFATTRLGDLAALTGTTKDQLVPFLFLGGALGLELAVRCVGRLGFAFSETGRDAQAAGGRALGGGALEGIAQVLRSRFLLGICGWLFAYALISSLLYFVQAEIVASAALDAGTQTEIFGWINFATQSLTLVLQLFLTGRIIMRVGVGWALAVLPIITLVGLGALAAAPVLGVLVVVQVARRGTGFALANPARHGLFAVLSRTEKYKAKAFVDTFVTRSGDATAASLKLLAQGTSVAVGTLFLVGAPLMGVWALLSLWLGRERDRRAQRP